MRVVLADTCTARRSSWASQQRHMGVTFEANVLSWLFQLVDSGLECTSEKRAERLRVIAHPFTRTTCERLDRSCTRRQDGRGKFFPQDTSNSNIFGRCALLVVGINRAQARLGDDPQLTIFMSHPSGRPLARR